MAIDKLRTIIRREYLTRVRSKGFIIGTVLSPILMMSIALVPMLIARVGGPDTYRVAILDRTGDAAFFNRISSLLGSADDEATEENVVPGERPTRKGSAARDRYLLRHVPIASDEDLTTRQDEMSAMIARGEIDAWMLLPADLLQAEKLSYVAKNVGDFEGRRQIADALNRALIERRIDLAGLRSDDVRNLTREITLEIRNQRGEEERGQTFMLAFALLMIIYITILVYGVMVMRGVIEEKQSRIIEVLLSSVRPFELMLGKLIGIGLVGLTQYLTWVLFALLISAMTAFPVLIAGVSSLPRIEPMLLVFFLVFYVLGYFLYATLYALVGALVSNEEDGQQLQLPVTMTIVIPIMISTLVLRDPDSTTSTVLSLIPFFAPMLMFLRIGLQSPPWWQIALSIVLLLVTIIGAVWATARVYRVGILMYGKRPTIPEILRWLRYS